MPAKKTATETKTEAAAKTKTTMKSKAVAAMNNLVTLTPQDNPKNLDRLYIPGASESVDGHDAGVAKWLFKSGLTIVVYKNWNAQPGDIITFGILISSTTVEALAIKKLEPGEEAQDSYYFAVDQNDLPDGSYALVYLVHYQGGPDYDMSYALVTQIKTELPAGDDNDQIEDGHSELIFSLSETTLVPDNASEGVICTVQPYPNMHPKDQIILHWGSVIITQTVAGKDKPTDIEVTYSDIVQAGDSHRLLVWFEVTDQVGNIPTPSSANAYVSVLLDVTKEQGLAIVNAGPQGYIDLELVDEKPVEVQVITNENVGPNGSLYDVEFRAYPPNGGVLVQHAFVTITKAGQPHSVFIPYPTVLAAAEGRMAVSFVLRRTSLQPLTVYSVKLYTMVRGRVSRLESPFAENYLDDTIADDPAHIVVQIPYYGWRQPTDRILLILRYVRALNDVILFEEAKEVGIHWPENGPVKRLIYRKDLQKFKGYRPEFYYVILTNFTRARAINLHESLRRVLTVY